MKRYMEVTESSFGLPISTNFERLFHSLEFLLYARGRNYFPDKIKNSIDIEVEDKTDARFFANAIGLIKYTYCDGPSRELIQIPRLKRPGRPRCVIYIEKEDCGLTVRQFKKRELEGLQKTHMTKNEIIKSKVVTKSKLDQLIKEGKLEVRKIGRRSFIDREELLACA